MTIRNLKILFILFLATRQLKSCELPDRFEFKTLHLVSNYYANQFMSHNEFKGIRCDVPPNVQFKFNLSEWQAKKQLDPCKNVSFWNSLHLRFPKGFILQKSFGLQDIIDFLLLFEEEFYITFANLQKFDADLGIVSLLPAKYSYPTKFIFHIFNTKFDFYVNSRVAKSCQDYFEANLTRPNGIFQVLPNSNYVEMFVLNSRFVRPICPLAFNKARIYKLTIKGMIDSFYKRNVIAFQNETRLLIKELDSRIDYLYLINTDNIDVDLRMLNPSVFYRLKSYFYYFFLLSFYY